MTSDQAATLIRERFSGAQVGPPVGRTDDPAPAGRVAPRPDAESRAPLAVQLPVDQWVAFARFAKETLGCRFFAFSTAIDWKEQGLEVVARVDNLDDHVSVMMRTRLDPTVPACPSLTPVYRGADWMERECYDMFGIRFEGHPDLRRILLTDDWVGHPLLKSYAVDTPHPPYR